MNRETSFLKICIFLFALAAVTAGYLVWHHYEIVNGVAGFKSFCSISRAVDCDVVNGSRYSEVLGAPLSAIALGYYLFALVLCAVGARSAYSRREALFLLAPFSVFSAAASIVMFSIMALALKTFCLLCAALQIIDLATLALILIALRRFTGERSLREDWARASRPRLIAFSGVGAALLAGTIALSATMKQEMPEDAAKFLEEFRGQPVLTVEPGDAPRQGFKGDNPPLRLVEFADFQCPACGMAARQMHQLLERYSDKVQLVFKNYPLDPGCNPGVKAKIHDSACLAARSAQCARAQGRFEDYYAKLFDNQRSITADSTRAWAAELGLDSKAFDACVAAPETDAGLRKDIDQANALGLRSTPTFYANGKRVEGAIDETKLRLILRELGL